MMELRLLLNKSERRGLSSVISAVILVGLVVAAIALVWGVVNNLVRDEIDTAEACFDIFDKVTVNSLYTCYNITAEHLRVQVGVRDIAVEEILLSIGGDVGSYNFILTNTDQVINDIWYYDEAEGDAIMIPGQDSARTYIVDMGPSGLGFEPKSVEIVPTIDGEKCEVSDILKEIVSCNLLVN